jgi:hypothetical protein
VMGSKLEANDTLLNYNLYAPFKQKQSAVAKMLASIRE